MRKFILCIIALLGGMSIALPALAYTRTPSGNGEYTDVIVNVDIADFADCVADYGDDFSIECRTQESGDVGCKKYDQLFTGGSATSIHIYWNDWNFGAPPNHIQRLRLWNNTDLKFCGLSTNSLEGDGNSTIFTLTDGPAPPLVPEGYSPTSTTAVANLFGAVADNLGGPVLYVFGGLTASAFAFYVARGLIALL